MMIILPSDEILQHQYPLLVAAHQNNIELFEALILYYQAQGSDRLNHELQKIDSLQQNILHIAMKNIELFKRSCELLGPDLIPTFIRAHDNQNDNVLHAIVEFGRIEALNHLITLSQSNIKIKDALKTAQQEKNTFHETPKEILKQGLDKSKTMKDLKTNDDNINDYIQRLRHTNILLKKHPFFSIPIDLTEETILALSNLTDSIQQMTETSFKTTANALVQQLATEFDNNQDLSVFLTKCNQLIKDAKPTLNKEAIGLFYKIY